MILNKRQKEEDPLRQKVSQERKETRKRCRKPEEQNKKKVHRKRGVKGVKAEIKTEIQVKMRSLHMKVHGVKVKREKAEVHK